MQEENSLGSLLFANQNPTSTQSGTTLPQSTLEELCRHSQAQHETSKDDQEKQANAASKKTKANTHIFPWMKETRSKPKPTGWLVLNSSIASIRISAFLPFNSGHFKNLEAYIINIILIILLFCNTMYIYELLLLFVTKFRKTATNLDCFLTVFCGAQPCLG